MFLPQNISIFFEILIALVAGIGLFLQHIFEIFVSPKLKDVRGQLVLITGGANGLGRELALQFASYGCNVAIVDIDFKNAKQTVKDVRKTGVKAEAFQVDVSNFDEIEKLQENIEAKLGFVDILVNNAAILLVKDVTEEKPDNLMKMINVNLMAHFWTSRVFLNGMIERKRGHIIAISSLAGLYGTPEGITYSTSKFGIRGFMESLALQLNHRDQSEFIKTTCAFPYFIRTNPQAINSLKDGGKVHLMLSPKSTAETITKAALRNEEIVAVPHWFYYLSYLPNFPIGFKKIFFKVLYNADFRGIDPTAAVKINDSEIKKN